METGSNIHATRTTARVRPKTWRFDFSLQTPTFLDPEEIRVACSQILMMQIKNQQSTVQIKNDAKKKIDDASKRSGVSYSPVDD